VAPAPTTTTVAPAGSGLLVGYLEPPANLVAVYQVVVPPVDDAVEVHWSGAGTVTLSSGCPGPGMVSGSGGDLVLAVASGSCTVTVAEGAQGPGPVSYVLSLEGSS
jgi:hypothetical protein